MNIRISKRQLTQLDLYCKAHRTSRRDVVEGLLESLFQEHKSRIDPSSMKALGELAKELGCSPAEAFRHCLQFYYASKLDEDIEFP